MGKAMGQPSMIQPSPFSEASPGLPHLLPNVRGRVYSTVPNPVVSSLGTTVRTFPTAGEYQTKSQIPRYQCSIPNKLAKPAKVEVGEEASCSPQAALDEHVVQENLKPMLGQSLTAPWELPEPTREPWELPSTTCPNLRAEEALSYVSLPMVLS